MENRKDNNRFKQKNTLLQCSRNCLTCINLVFVIHARKFNKCVKFIGLFRTLWEGTFWPSQWRHTMVILGLLAYIHSKLFNSGKNIVINTQINARTWIRRQSCIGASWSIPTEITGRFLSPMVNTKRNMAGKFRQIEKE